MGNCRRVYDAVMCDANLTTFRKNYLLSFPLKMEPVRSRNRNQYYCRNHGFVLRNLESHFKRISLIFFRNRKVHYLPETHKSNSRLHKLFKIHHDANHHPSPSLLWPILNRFSTEIIRLPHINHSSYMQNPSPPSGFSLIILIYYSRTLKSSSLWINFNSWATRKS
jgi:hypothetical protein